MSTQNVRKLAILGVVASLLPLSAAAFYQGPTFNGTFQPIKEPDCLSPSFFNGYTVGGQYLGPNNGVLMNQYSMLGRWQSNSIFANVPSYDMGRWTGLHVTNQRGYYNDPAGSPGIALNCYDIGMLLNTWNVPHRPIVGGGYNDMWGFAWGAGSRPRPFTLNGIGTHLVLQANAGIGVYMPSAASTG